MPARSERILIFSDDNEHPTRIMALPLWWDRNEFMKRFQHREIDSGNPVDANYSWSLTTAEAIAWNEESRVRFIRDPRHAEPGIAEAMRHLEDLLSKASRVVVESYEWEYGTS